MTVEQTKIVDVISLTKDSGEVVLTIADHLEWDDLGYHLEVLQSKLNSYLAFVESGELLTVYPKAQDKAVRFDIAFKHPPVQLGEEFLSRAKSVVEGAGFKLSWALFAASHDN